jgi:hypothetical protein
MLVALFLTGLRLVQGAEPQEFIAQDAGFAVTLPGTPTRLERSNETPDGPSRAITYQLNQGGCVYLAQRVDFPAGSSEAGATKMLDKQRESLRKKNEQSGGAILSETAVQLGPYPGLEIAQEPRPGMTSRARSFAVGGEMFTVAFTKGPGCSASDMSASQYLHSLRLLDRPGR